jgi:hypothetical protein
MVLNQGLKFTPDSCKRLCSAEPACQFWIYDKRMRKCELYSLPQKQCTAFLGMPTRVKEECEGGNGLRGVI